MNTQDRLSDLDRANWANLQLRQQLLNNQRELFFRDVAAAYGNPGEQLGIGDSGELIRTPAAPPAAAPAAAPPAPLAEAPTQADQVQDSHRPNRRLQKTPK